MDSPRTAYFFLPVGRGQIGLLLSPEDQDRLPEVRESDYVNVTDLRTGVVYQLYREDCGLPHCCCSVVANPLQ